MTSSSGSQLEPRLECSNLTAHTVSQTHPEQKQGTEGNGEILEQDDDQPQHQQFSGPTIYAQWDENEETTITSIRATDVALGLGRIPVGFYVAVQYNGLEWRTENKPVSVDNEVVEWDGPISIPSSPSTTVSLGICASFELQPMLGDGELLRKLTTTVEQLLDRSARVIPFTFFPKEGDATSPCSSVWVTMERQWRESDNESLSFRCVTAESPGPLEEATCQGHSALSRYRKHGKKHDLECSIQHFEHAFNVCPLDHPCRAAAQSNLASAKFILCRVAGVNQHPFDVPLALYRNALAARPVGHPDRPSTLVHLAVVHVARFEKHRDEVDAARAEALLREAMTLSSTKSYVHRAAAFIFQLHAERVVGPEVDPVEEREQMSMEWNSASDVTVEDAFISGVRLLERFEQLGDLADLQRGISLFEEIVRYTSTWDQRHIMGLTNLGAVLAHRFERLGELRDLERSISIHRDVIGFSFDSDPNQPVRLCHLGGTLLLRFQRLGELTDLEEAISWLKHAVNLSPVGHFLSLNHLGVSLQFRFERLGKLEDLEEAIVRLKDAVNFVPDSNPYKPVCLNNLGNSFLVRFQRSGNLSDLEEAIRKQRDAIDLTPDEHARKPGHVNNLGCLLLTRFQHLGDPTNLDQAIFRFGNAVDLTPDGHPLKPGRLSNLGNSLFDRFKHLGELIDLEKAIFTLENALDLIPDGHPSTLRTLNNLAIALRYRFERLGELRDIEQAISRQRNAVYLIPDDHPDKPNVLNNLGNTLRVRFSHLWEFSDIEEAISRHSDAIDLTPDGHPDKLGRLTNLGNSFLARFQHLGELVDLEQTISRYMDTLHLTPDGHPGKPRFLSNLGSAFLYRFEQLGELGDLEQAMSPYSHAACSSVDAISVRFQASEEWISCARTLRHHSLLDAYSLAISLLPQLAWTGFSLADRYIELMQGADVVREAAAAALDAGFPETAVEWLEQGRSVVWEEHFQLRSSYEELSSVYPDHARRLRELSTALERTSAAREKSLSSLSEQTEVSDYHAAMSLEQQAGSNRTLAIWRDKLLQEIRGLPGFERFLLHKEFSQLHASAHSGPVIILNAAKTRCDALIVLAEVDHVLHVPLPNITSERCKGLQKMMMGLLGPTRVAADDERVGNVATRVHISWVSLLSTLWNDIVKPVLDALAISTPGDLPRIFWCPTGPFTFLPFHAAGIYDSQHADPGHKVFDFVVSSYTPTLSILASPSNPNATSSDTLRLLAVGQPSSDGQSRLPGVDNELRYIRDVVQDSPLARTTLVESSVGTVEEILALMKDADWVHFACHGIQDGANPTNSGLCLANKRRLKLSDIIAVSRPRGGLAFLSACQTATGDKKLSDEAIHVAAGMLFAGYGGVVGTMWSISDRLAPLIARDVYGQLFRSGTRPDYRDAARALQDAVGRLRDHDGASFVEWLPFIHVGI